MKIFFHINPMRKRKKFSENRLFWTFGQILPARPLFQIVLLFYSHASVGYTMNLWYRYTYTLTSYRAGVLLRYYRTGMQRKVQLPCSPSWQKVRRQLPFVPASLAVFKNTYNYRHGVLVVGAFASQSEDLGSTIVDSDQKT